MKNILDILIDDFHERALPELMSRNQPMARVLRKANTVIGMRRSGKTWFCYQQMQEFLGKGLEKERLLYLNFEDEREIALIRRASQLAGLGMMAAIRSTKAGVYEYQLDAAARYVFLVNGARLDAYRSITASGTKNISNGHYFRNDKKLEDGDLVLMDYAPDYHYYVSDIGRMWPVNGKYSNVQREILQFILDYRNAVMARIRPGVSAKQIQDEAKIAMELVFARTQFSKPIYEKAARKLVETGGGTFSHRTA